MARNSSTSWLDHLPAVLLSIRSSIREDSGVSPAELVFGSPLRLPGQLLPDPAPLAPPSTDFVADLHRSLLTALPMPVVHHSARSAVPSVPQSLSSSSFVFVRVDAVRPPLCRPYEGPYRVLEHGPKTFKLEKSGRPWVVSVDRLKPVPPVPSSSSPSSPPASLAREDMLLDLPPPLQPLEERPGLVPLPASPVPLPPAPLSPVRGDVAEPYRSRFGRISRPPDRLNL